MTAAVGSPVRDCLICGEPIPARPYQDASVRTCGPAHAKRLALKEHPDINRVSAREDEP